MQDYRWIVKTTRGEFRNTRISVLRQVVHHANQPSDATMLPQNTSRSLVMALCHGHNRRMRVDAPTELTSLALRLGAEARTAGLSRDVPNRDPRLDDFAKLLPSFGDFRSAMGPLGLVPAIRRLLQALRLTAAGDVNVGRIYHCRVRPVLPDLGIMITWSSLDRAPGPAYVLRQDDIADVRRTAPRHRGRS